MIKLIAMLVFKKSKSIVSIFVYVLKRKGQIPGVSKLLGKWSYRRLLS